jgi:hypothetical protein
MPTGIPFNRQYVLVFEDGRIILDWGDGLFQELETGEFFRGVESQVCRAIMDDELEWLKRVGRVEAYNRTQVFFLHLPERPVKTID